MSRAWRCLPLGAGPGVGAVAEQRGRHHAGLRRPARVGDEEKNIACSDYAQWAMNDRFQILVYNPAGNVIEAHQDMSA
jgi:hypothetical protein